MTPLIVACGAALVLLVAWDITLTLLHPIARGPLSYVANRATWSAARAVSLRLLKGRGLSYAGPLAVAVNVWAWVAGLWLGYALVYLPFVDSLNYDPSAPFANKGFPEAVYLSGAALTTVGFGDIAAAGEVLRLVTTVEAASGFGVLSAAIAFVLSIYPLISQLRSTGILLTDAGALELDGAIRVVRDAGSTELASTVRELTENHEHLRRFPVLYYFETGNQEESLSTVVRGSALLLVALRSDAGGGAANAAVYADMFETVLLRLLDDLERDFVGGRRKTRPKPVVSPEERDERVDAMLRELPTLANDETPEQRAALASLLVRVEAVLEAVAEEHGHGARALLPRRP